MTDKGNPKQKATSKWLLKLLLVISSILGIVLAFTYAIQPDFCAALTFWPIWVWAIPGIVLSLVSLRMFKKAGLTVTFAWVLIVVFIAEEPLSFIRGFIGSDCTKSCKNGTCLRIVSLNCAGGNIEAAEEIFPYSPDIILLQESPSAKYLDTFTKKIFANRGAFVLYGDTAVLARGRVTKTEIVPDKWSFWTGARIKLPEGIEIEAINAHFSPPPTGTNLLSLDCWREHYEDRISRLQLVEAIDEQIKSIKDNVPLIVGGDFNAKPWAAESKILSLRLQDTFKQGGVGWPGTGPTHFPLWRVDQIWASKHFKAIAVKSVKCKNSDHRMVICDLCKK